MPGRGPIPGHDRGGFRGCGHRLAGIDEQHTHTARQHVFERDGHLFAHGPDHLGQV